MTREQEPTPKKTSYEVIKDLFEMPSGQSETARISVEEDIKTFVLEDGSLISIKKFEPTDGNEQPWFDVDIYGVASYRIDQEEGLIQGLIDNVCLPLVDVQLGNFSMQVALQPHSDLIRVPIEHREEVGEILAGWTRASIEQDRLGDSPFKLNFPLPKKQVE